MEPTITFSVRKIMTVMIVAVVLLHAMSLMQTINAQRYAPETLLQGQSHGLLRMFDVSGESNVPEWYSVITLAFSSVLLIIIGLNRKELHDKFARYWLFMGFVFAFLSLDEGACIHEGVGSLMSAHVKTGGALSYGWVIPWGIFTIGFALLYVRFLLSLPRKTAVLMVIAGAIYVGGALGMELVEGVLDEKFGALSLTEVIMRDIEEWGEMGGILLFNYTLLSYLKDQVGPVMISLGVSPSATAIRVAPTAGRSRVRKSWRRRLTPGGQSRAGRL